MSVYRVAAPRPPEPPGPSRWVCVSRRARARVRRWYRSWFGMPKYQKRSWAMLGLAILLSPLLLILSFWLWVEERYTRESCRR